MELFLLYDERLRYMRFFVWFKFGRDFFLNLFVVKFKCCSEVFLIRFIGIFLLR